MFTLVIGGGIAAILIVLIFQRVDEKKKEDFDKRDN